MTMKSATKFILLAHRDGGVRDRFAAALADARHQYVMASTAEEAVTAAAQRDPVISLALLDLGLDEDPVVLVRRLRATHTALPVLVFAGTVASAADSRALIPAAISGYINEHAATAQILPALAPHLFPASFDRRLAPRTVLSVPVSYRSGTTIAGAVTLNISRGGLAVRTLTPLAPGAAVVVRFRLPPASEDIERAGHVVWADQRVGMGIQFEVELEE
jgi:ActR/RegA family two-component response regulator